MVRTSRGSSGPGRNGVGTLPLTLDVGSPSPPDTPGPVVPEAGGSSTARAPQGPPVPRHFLRRGTSWERCLQGCRGRSNGFGEVPHWRGQGGWLDLFSNRGRCPLRRPFRPSTVPARRRPCRVDGGGRVRTQGEAPDRRSTRPPRDQQPWDGVDVSRGSSTPQSRGGRLGPSPGSLRCLQASPPDPGHRFLGPVQTHRSGLPHVRSQKGLRHVQPYPDGHTTLRPHVSQVPDLGVPTRGTGRRVVHPTHPDCMSTNPSPHVRLRHSVHGHGGDVGGLRQRRVCGNHGSSPTP